MKRAKRSENKGITLIALVITIIVLLILAGVTIALILNQGGVFEKAQEAKEITKIRQLEEELNIELVSLKAEQYGTATVEEIVNKLQTKGKIENQSEEDKIKNIIVVEERYRFEIEQKEGQAVRIVYKESGEKSIQFYVYDNQNNKLKIRVTYADDHGIQEISYPNGAVETVEQINGEKEKTIDYIVEANGSYTFRFKNTKSDTLSKVLEVNEGYRNSFIDIKTKEESDVVKIEIDYKASQNTQIKQCKIGDSGTWQDYTGEISKTYSEITTLKDSNGDLTIYAKAEDGAGNKVEIQKKVAIVTTKMKKIAAAQNRSLAIGEDGQLWGWGDIFLTHTSIPTKILIGTKCKEVSASNYHILAIDETGQLWTWGMRSRRSIGRWYQ